MGHQKKRPMLEPVLENYMGPPISYNDAPRKPRHGRRSSAKVTPTSGGAGKQAKGATPLNPLNIFGKLRERYIKTMNELATGGDYAAVAGYHGCVPGPEFPSTTEYHERRRELDALREALGALPREHARESE